MEVRPSRQPPPVLTDFFHPAPSVSPVRSPDGHLPSDLILEPPAFPTPTPPHPQHNPTPTVVERSLLRDYDTSREPIERTLLVTGSRHWQDRPEVLACLRCFAAKEPRHTEWTLVHGNCRGADLIAGEAARRLGWTVCAHTAAWDRLDPKAGCKRNQKMIDTFQPHYAVAFVTKESRGTWDCVNRLKEYANRRNSRLIDPVQIVR
jgi:hypothetical protein